MGRDAVRSELLRRHGFQGVNGRWMVFCQAECGRLLLENRTGKALVDEPVTMDRYPIPGSAGGTYHIDNVRLTCRQCNTEADRHGYDGPSVLVGMSTWQRKIFKRAQRRGTVPDGREAVFLTPQDVFGPDYVAGVNGAKQVGPVRNAKPAGLTGPAKRNTQSASVTNERFASGL